MKIMKIKDKQLLLIALIVSIFIYNRSLDYYKVIPRNNLLAAFLIGLWTYIALKFPWFVIIGLIVLNILDKIM